MMVLNNLGLKCGHHIGSKKNALFISVRKKIVRKRIESASEKRENIAYTVDARANEYPPTFPFSP